MLKTIQDFLADATLKASQDLTTAFLRIPENKRNWSPDEKARTALDQFAECALLCGYTAETITNKRLAPGSMERFFPEKAELQTKTWEKIHAEFDSNAAKVVAAIRAVTDEEMEMEITIWRPMTIATLIAYPHWNMTYHEGQINYIASILDCLG